METLKIELVKSAGHYIDDAVKIFEAVPLLSMGMFLILTPLLISLFIKGFKSACVSFCLFFALYFVGIEWLVQIKDANYVSFFLFKTCWFFIGFLTLFMKVEKIRTIIDKFNDNQRANKEAKKARVELEKEKEKIMKDAEENAKKAAEKEMEERGLF